MEKLVECRESYTYRKHSAWAPVPLLPSLNNMTSARASPEIAEGIDSASTFTDYSMPAVDNTNIPEAGRLLLKTSSAFPAIKILFKIRDWKGISLAALWRVKKNPSSETKKQFVIRWRMYRNYLKLIQKGEKSN